VTIPAGVTEIHKGAFAACGRLTSILVSPDNPAFISKDGVLFDKAGKWLCAFPAGRDGAYVIPVGVEIIARNAFMGCAKLTAVSIPTSVSEIRDEAFAGCTGLASVRVPDSVTEIRGDAFVGCAGLSDETRAAIRARFGKAALGEADDDDEEQDETDTPPFLGEGARVRIGDAEISGYVVITGAHGGNAVWNVPEKIGGLPVAQIGDNTTIGDARFTGFTSARFPDSVCRINTFDFLDCKELTTMYLGANAADFGSVGGFWACSGLTSITVSPDNPEYCSKDGVLFDKEGTSLCAFPAGRGGAYSIPDGVTEITPWAFADCAKLTSIAIPGSVTKIETRAFHGCDSLTSVRVPGGVIEIGAGAFSACKRLASITVSLDNPAYASVDGILFDKTGTELLGFPAGKQGEYAIPAGVTKIGEEAFCGCAGLTSVLIPDSVTEIGNGAFGQCEGLSEETRAVIRARFGKEALGEE